MNLIYAYQLAEKVRFTSHNPARLTTSKGRQHNMRGRL